MAPKTMDSISSFPVYSIDQSQFKPSPGAVLYVSPNTSQVKALMADIVELVGLDTPGYVLFNTAEDAEDAYR